MLLGVRDLRLIALSTGLSALGNEVALIVLSIKVHDLTHSGPVVSALLVAGLAPLLLLAPVAGLLVDRRETVRVLLVASVLQAVAAASLAFVDSLPVILVLSFVLGTGFAVSQPAIFALVPTAVGDERATEANAQLETARYAGWVTGPLLASGLASAVGTDLPLLLDAGTFVAVALATASLGIRRPPGEVGKKGEHRQAREGLVHVARDPLLFLSFIVLGGAILFAAIERCRGVLRQGSAARGGPGLRRARGGVALRDGRGFRADSAEAASSPARFGCPACGGRRGSSSDGRGRDAERRHRGHRVLRGRCGERSGAAYSGLAAGTQIGATALGGALLGAVGARGSLFVAGLGGAAVGLLGLARYSRLPREIRAPTTRGTTGR